MARKKIEGFTREALHEPEVWIMLRIAKPKCCFNCKDYRDTSCLNLSLIEKYTLEHFNRRRKGWSIFHIGCQCRDWC